MTDTALQKLSTARTLLAEARTLDEILAIRDTAAAVRSYAKAANLGRDVQNHAAEVCILAERQTGVLLARMAETGERQTGGGDKRSPSSSLTVIQPPTLAFGY